MKINYVLLESLVLLIVVAGLLLCSCKALPVRPNDDSEYERYIKERQQDERDKDFQDRTPHLPIPRR